MSGSDAPVFGAAAAAQVREQFAWPRVFEELFCIYREVCAHYQRNGTG
jgi:hypothetical protein